MPHDPRLERALEEFFESERLSRRRFIGRAGSTGLALSGLSTLLAACGGVEGSAEKNKSQPQNKTAAVNHPKTDIGNWTFSNWPLYIDKAVIKDFNKKFGGKCKYVEEINDNNEFYGKIRQQLEAGQPINRDIIVPTDYLASRLVRLNYVEPIDKKNVPNIANMVDNLKSINYDPKREYSMPWQSGAIGIGYNPKKTGRELKSVKDLFDPKFKGRVTMLSEPYDSANTVLLGDGVDASKATIDQILGAIEKIDKANRAGQFRRFTGNDYTTDLAKGNVWVSLAYSGEVRLPRGGRDALHGQHDDAGQGPASVRGRDDDELRLRARGRGQDRGVRQLHPAGEGRQGDLREEAAEARREPADLPARGHRREAASVPGALAERRAQDAGGDGAGHRRVGTRC
jgi:spermidine/putrescine transport system substrate-binding protein